MKTPVQYAAAVQKANSDRMYRVGWRIILKTYCRNINQGTPSLRSKLNTLILSFLRWAVQKSKGLYLGNESDERFWRDLYLKRYTVQFREEINKRGYDSYLKTKPKIQRK